VVTRKTAGPAHDHDDSHAGHGGPAALQIDWALNWDDSRLDPLTCRLPGYPGWRILPEIEATETGLRLRRLVIEPDGDDTPASGITTRLLREIRTGQLLAALRAATAQARHYAGRAPDLSIATRVGRRGRDKTYYALWAAEYAEALTRSPKPVAELAARHYLSPSQIRNLMHACRVRGMLTPAPPGQAGGKLTPAAIALLEAEQ